MTHKERVQLNEKVQIIERTVKEMVKGYNDQIEMLLKHISRQDKIIEGLTKYRE